MIALNLHHGKAAAIHRFAHHWYSLRIEQPSGSKLPWLEKKLPVNAGQAVNLNKSFPYAASCAE
jgi:hypothetical protein